MIADQHHHELYVSIDALFDTRLACLEEVDVQLALFNLKNGWDKRLADAPLGLDEQVFKELYAARDVDTLSRAVQTPVFEIIRHWLLEAIKKLGEVPIDSTLSLAINFFPYQLPKDAALEVAQKIKDALKINVQINILNMDPKQITPSVVKKRYDGMIMYDGLAWVNSQEAAFEGTNCPQTTLYLPRFYSDHLPSSTELEEVKVASKDPFRDLEVNIGPLVSLEFLPIHVFSSVIPSMLAFAETEAAPSV